MSTPAIHHAAAQIDTYRRSNPHAAVDLRDIATVENENREIARIVARALAENINLNVSIAIDEAPTKRAAFLTGLQKMVQESF